MSVERHVYNPGEKSGQKAWRYELNYGSVSYRLFPYLR